MSPLTIWTMPSRAPGSDGQQRHWELQQALLFSSSNGPQPSLVAVAAELQMPTAKCDDGVLHIQCKMPGCMAQFSIAGSTEGLATRQQDSLALARAAIGHQQHKHPQEASAFISLYRHDVQQQGWTSLIGHCACCEVLVTITDGGKQRHLDSVIHRRAAAAAAVDAPASTSGVSSSRKRRRRASPEANLGAAREGSGDTSARRDVPAPAEMPAEAAARAAARAAAVAAAAAAATGAPPPVLSLEWSLSGSSALDAAARAAIDSLSAHDLLDHVYFVAKTIRFRHRTPVLQCLHWTLSQYQRAVTDAAAANVENRAAATAAADAYCKLWFLLPTLLLLPDGSKHSRAARIRLFHKGDLPTLVASTLQVCDARAVRDRRNLVHGSTEHHQYLSALARRPGGIGQAARIMSQTAADRHRQLSHRPQDVLQTLRDKHPAPDADDVRQQGVAEAEAIMAQALAANAQPAEPTFTQSELKKAVARSSANSAPGPNGLSFQHLQDLLRSSTGPLVQDTLELLTWLANCIYDTPEQLSDTFWRLHTAAKLTAVGAKDRPIACGDALRRLFAGLWCRKHRRVAVDLLSQAGQFGVGIVGGAERVACVIETLVQAGALVLSLDVENAFNSVSRAAVLKAVALHAITVPLRVSRVWQWSHPLALAHDAEQRPACSCALAAGCATGRPSRSAVVRTDAALAAGRIPARPPAAQSADLSGRHDDLYAAGNSITRVAIAESPRAR